MRDSCIFSNNERTESYIAACEKHSCKVAFFCIGKMCLKKKNTPLLSQLDERGHFLCNHSMNHLHLSSQDIRIFENEIKRLDTVLSKYTNMRKWYRFPYLDYGNRIATGGSNTKMLQSLQILKDLNYTEGFVSINTFDWHIDTRLKEAVQAGHTVDYTSLKNLYLRLVKIWCEYYITFYEKELPGKITHTLLLHANDLNSLFLDDLLMMIEDSNWNIVSPEKAFFDVSWRSFFIDHPSKLSNHPPFLDCSEIDRLLLEENVFTK